ncbi:hypothetical protein [Methylobacterium tarhaniae]|uniref:hypothetical protein n=1 Tax=Methylobacterium tarhaniae TaxID=1187852 RepID=UPI000A7153AA|nr:hypothetical protein [Methylobacterium tarhaniae]
MIWIYLTIVKFGVILVSNSLVATLWGVSSPPLRLPEWISGSVDIGSIDDPTVRLAIIVTGLGGGEPGHGGSRKHQSDEYRGMAVARSYRRSHCDARIQSIRYRLERVRVRGCVGPSLVGLPAVMQDEVIARNLVRSSASPGLDRSERCA